MTSQPFPLSDLEDHWAERQYLDLLKRVLTRYGFPAQPAPYIPNAAWKRRLLSGVERALANRGLVIRRKRSDDMALRREGRDWPTDAETMIGLERLGNLQFCIESALDDDVPGDIVEAGVWRGGASIFARAVLSAYRSADRTVWVADSFQGLPAPDESYPADVGDEHHTQAFLRVDQQQVRTNFERYGLLDYQVRFLAGWFSDTLPTAPIDRIAVLRADGDMYSSTIDILENLYDKVSPGGFVIIDDYGAIEACAQAVDDFRMKRDITDPLVTVDWTGAYWRRS